MSDNVIGVAMLLFFVGLTIFFLVRRRRADEKTAAANRVKWEAIPLAERETIRAANIKQAQEDARLRQQLKQNAAQQRADSVAAFFCWVVGIALFLGVVWLVREAAIDIIAEGIRRAGR
jgi:hypothetical protein